MFDRKDPLIHRERELNASRFEYSSKGSKRKEDLTGLREREEK